ncbi:hypothetical protein C7H19_19415 [Aphanothece hegewaldii CCALA 016]|uniref:Uncharacterized protein n=1 Tax=Aphanothece hegewaldii CCALA 016 TaxID=2107694 RepID=A0A2T1LTG3_9CHRO|nr:hypothetical protein [Aphanothece hegewaldii]PSF33894.1 hypothetical protein C7H19_19415 [Aphanothece hegewaldii CCALA 016]
MTQTTFIQIPLELIKYVRSLSLDGTQYDLLSSQTELEKLTDVEAACFSFNVFVTGEEVQG